MRRAQRVALETDAAARSGVWKYVDPACLAVVVLVVVAAVGIDASGSAILAERAMVCLSYLLLVVGQYAFSGLSGSLSFGQYAFAGVGAYTFALLSISPGLKSGILASAPGWLVSLHVNLVVAVLLAALVGGAVGLITSFAVAPLSGLTAGMATFALLVISNVVFTNLTAITNGGDGIEGVPGAGGVGGATALFGIATVVVMVFEGTKIGLSLRALRGSERAARALGVPVAFYRAIAWTLSAMICAFGGVIYASSTGSVDPGSFYLDSAFLLIAMLIVGGRTRLLGALVGGLLVGVVQQTVSQLETGIGSVHLPGGTGGVVLGALLIAALAFRPEGIVRGADPARSVRARLRQHASKDWASGVPEGLAEPAQSRGGQV